MYKKQLTVQKILCMAAVIVSAVVFFYALGIMTDLYDALYDTMRNPNDVFQTDVPGSIVYYNMQEFNNYFLKYSIGLILLAVLLLITNTHVRRKYYIGNYVATGLFAVASVAISIFGHTYIVKEHAEMWGTLYTESTFWFDIHYLVFALLLIVAALLVANAVWKTRLMKEEQQLLRGEKGVQA